MRTQIVNAHETDGKDMLELIESSGSKDAMELIYTRRPNPYLSYMNESKDVKVGICRDNDEKIKYQAASVARNCFLNGQVTHTGYITGIKKRNDVRIFDWPKMIDFLRFDDCDIYFCSFLNSNIHGSKAFLKHRNYLPDLIKLCDYRTYIFNPRQFSSMGCENYTFHKMEKRDKQKVKDFLNSEGKKYNFSIHIGDIEEQFSGLSTDSCYILEECGKIVAFGALWDRTDWKQYIVKRYSIGLKILQKIPVLMETIGYMALPKENETFQFPILSFIYAKDNERKYYEAVLGGICKVAKRQYDMVVMGTDLRNPYLNLFETIKKISFDSSLYYLSYSGSLKISLDKMCAAECAML